MIIITNSLSISLALRRSPCGWSQFHLTLHERRGPLDTSVINSAKGLITVFNLDIFCLIHTLNNAVKQSTSSHCCLSWTKTKRVHQEVRANKEMSSPATGRATCARPGWSGCLSRTDKSLEMRAVSKRGGSSCRGRRGRRSAD